MVTPRRTEPGHTSIAGVLLRGILVAVLCALGLLVAYAAQTASPYDPWTFSRLRNAAAAYAVLNLVFVWKVRTAARYIALVALLIAAGSFAEYAWRVYF